MRLFVAAELPDEMREALAETSAALRDAVRGRYVAPDSFHLTLAFLGEVPGSAVPQVADALEEGCRGHAPIEAELSALGSFGKARSAVLWQAVQGAGLSELAGDVRTALKAAGFTYDEKGFLPHVTLMRAADVTRGALPMASLACGTIDTVTLFKSDLSGARPAYTALQRVALLPA